MLPDIQNRTDIELLVNTFYEQIRQDPLIGILFNSIIKDRWPEHLATMYRFWETVLLGIHTYSGAPFMPHAKLLLQQEHFDRWLLLFGNTTDQYFTGPVADDAKARAAKMAVLFLSKITYLKTHPHLRPLT